MSMRKAGSKGYTVPSITPNSHGKDGFVIIRGSGAREADARCVVFAHRNEAWAHSNSGNAILARRNLLCPRERGSFNEVGPSLRRLMKTSVVTAAGRD
jgi:hypothetical protein